MISARRQPGMFGPDIGAMAPPAPLQFAAPPSVLPPDATGAQAIDGLANLASAFQSKFAGGPAGQPTDAPMRRKSSFAETASYA